MYQEGAAEFVADQRFYYPAATDYGYYCTGFEAPVEWEGHTVFTTNGPNIQYVGGHTESLPYIYYTPTYGYSQSSYNPYSSNMSGTVTNDGPIVGAEKYYAIAANQNPISSPPMVPVVIQPEMIPSSYPNSLLDFHALSSNRADGRALKQNPASDSAAFARNPLKSAANRTNSLTRGDGPSKQSAMRGNVSTAYSSPAPTYVRQGRSPAGVIQSTNVISSGKLLSHSNKLKAESSINARFSDFGSNATNGAILDKTRPKVNTGNYANDVSDALNELNQGPGTNRSKNQLSVIAYTTKAGGTDVEGNIVIYIDQYNRDDFQVDYDKAKFFVIKSFSEDDVHKSIKYNVWSSTSHGNKKLQAAYEDAQKLASGKPNGCPIFLFFSVNGSGQFCGVAEMIGPVDFHMDMDFWQQDKWSGSFTVKWHLIKDVPNHHFRRIILENNENRPVTHSRDSQELMLKQGMEMLKIFKSHPLKTFLLDDFMYYENRQKILQEEKARRLVKSFERSHFVSPVAAANDQDLTDQPMKDEKFVAHSDSVWLKKDAPASAEMASPVSNTIDPPMTNKTTAVIPQAEDDVASAFKISLLTINPMEAESKPVTSAANVSAKAAPIEIVNVGSMPVRVTTFAESPGFLTIGTIPLDPSALKLDKGGDAKGGA